MKYVIKSIFRPLENRHYTNKKVSAWLYTVRFLPIILICLFGTIVVDSFFWLILVGVVVYGILDYILFDAFLDKVSWKLVWHHFYTDEVHEPSAEHDAIKAFETNPSQENRKALQKHLKQ